MEIPEARIKPTWRTALHQFYRKLSIATGVLAVLTLLAGMATAVWFLLLAAPKPHVDIQFCDECSNHEMVIKTCNGTVKVPKDEGVFLLCLSG